MAVGAIEPQFYEQLIKGKYLGAVVSHQQSMTELVIQCLIFIRDIGSVDLFVKAKHLVKLVG